MANCGDLERGLQDMNRRIRDLERQSSGGGGGGNNLNEEAIIKKAVERVYKDRRWLACEKLIKKIIFGAA